MNWITAGEICSHTYVAAHVEANAPIRRVELRVDGQPVDAEVMGRDESVSYQPRHWRAGRHQVAVTVWDVAGQVTRRAWTFRII